MCVLSVFCNDTATTEIYSLSLHDALPISRHAAGGPDGGPAAVPPRRGDLGEPRGVVGAGPRRLAGRPARSEEHTSELQSRQYLVCRLLLEKKTRVLT